MRLLNKDLENPYLETTPFFEPFENLLSKARQLPESIIDKKLQELELVINAEESDGLAIYEAEELSYALIMVKVERNPSLKEILIKEDEEYFPTIEEGNPYQKGGDFYNFFERKVSDLTMLETNDLIEMLKKYKEKNIDIEAEQEIKAIKTALKIIG